MKRYTFCFLLILLITGWNAFCEDKGKTEESTRERIAPVMQNDSRRVESTDMNEHMLKIQIGNITLNAVLEDNSSAAALKDLLSNGPITVTVQNYGGFEKVGVLPQSLLRNDMPMTAVPGDIMLYQGNSIVFFYGSNSWSYTKLGKIIGYDQKELRKILGGNDAVVSLMR